MAEVIKKKKLEYINFLRGIAILLIVAGHTFVWGKTGGDIYRINSFLFRGGTLLFVFIAGFLFQYLSYKFDYKKFIVNKFKNVIMPYFITMLPVALLFALTCHDTHHFLYYYPPAVRFFNVMIWGKVIAGALWFIPMITIYYIISPILIHIKKNKILWYSILICTFLYTVYMMRPGLNDSAAANVGVTLFEWNIKQLVYTLQRAAYFLSSYLLGMELCSVYENHTDFIKKEAKNIFGISLICYLFSCYFCVFVLKMHLGSMNIGRYFLIILLMSACLLCENYIINKPFLKKSLDVLADYSFGIFFIHHYIVYFMITHCPYRNAASIKYNAIQHHNTIAAVLYSGKLFLITLLSSLLILFVIKYILEKAGVKNTRMFTGVGSKK